ncbi:cytochrome P450 [Dendrothele bispora CBS 962.96]|uniref:Cytochrome P450 n=1 Tax=Dendrothele bispora (strain CBS 962.96) TaxID=1314807 RepID=A0A4S8MJW2_DENBC|nr:cytochrome P450 [Dendrothele bispora CBS 962.96]
MPDKSQRSQPHCPPGPNGYWFLGLFRIPTVKPWLTYVEWGKKYGDLVHFTRLGRHYLVINSLEATNEILDRQAGLTSDRPVHTELDDIDTVEFILLFSCYLLAQMPYGDEWRVNRRLFHQNFRPLASIDYRPIEIKHVHKFLSSIGSLEMSLKDQVSALSQGVMFDSVYGLEIYNNKEEMPTHARDVVDLSELILLPGWDAFKSIPFIRFFPSWLPGSHQWITYKKMGAAIQATKEDPWGQTMKAMKSDENHSSLIAKLMSEKPQNKSSQDIESIKYMGAQAVAAAADTTMSAVCTFFLAMSLYPNVQQKAQEELDTVLGHGKLPTFDDRSSLPYIDAIYQEVMRWHPAIPLGLPHFSIKDIYYRNYYIPKGKAMTHDGARFYNPDQFIPERHLNQKNNINSILAYGFGRRVCVGRYMADDMIWMTIASVLATKNISSLPNENVEDYFTDGTFW